MANSLSFSEFRAAVRALSKKFAYDIDLRAIWKTGVAPAEAVTICDERKLWADPPAKVEYRGGRPRSVGVGLKQTLSTATVDRRLADAMAAICRKLLRHRLEPADRARLMQLKDQCEDIYLRPRD